MPYFSLVGGCVKSAITTTVNLPKPVLLVAQLLTDSRTVQPCVCGALPAAIVSWSKAPLSWNLLFWIKLSQETQ